MPTAAQAEDSETQADDSEMEIVQPRPSVSTISRVSSALSSVSHVSLVKSRQAVHAVGSYLGLTNTGSHLDLWRDRLAERAQDGSVGLHLPRRDHPEGVRESLARLNAALSRSERLRSRCSEDDVFHGGALGMTSTTSLTNPASISDTADSPEHAKGTENESESGLHHAVWDGSEHVQENESEHSVIGSERDGEDGDKPGDTERREDVDLEVVSHGDVTVERRPSSTSTCISEEDVAVFFSNSDVNLAEIERKLYEGEIIIHEDFDDSAMADCSVLTEQDQQERKRTSTTSSEFSVIEHDLAHDKAICAVDLENHRVWAYLSENEGSDSTTLLGDDQVTAGDKPEEHYIQMGGGMTSLTEDNYDLGEEDLYTVCSTPIPRDGFRHFTAVTNEPLPMAALEDASIPVTNELLPITVSEEISIPIPAEESSSPERPEKRKTRGPPFPYLPTHMLQNETLSDTVMARKLRTRSLEPPTHTESTVGQEGIAMARQRHSVTFNPMVTEVVDKEHTTSSFLKESTPERSTEGVAQHPFEPGEPVMYRSEALHHYKQYVKLEIERKNHFLMERRDELLQQLDEENENIGETLKLAQNYYYGSAEEHQSAVQKLRNVFRRSKADPASRQSRGLAKLQLSDNLNVRRQLDELPVYTPWLIYVIMSIQILLFAICVGLNGVSDMGLEPEMKLRSGVLTFRGRETVEHWVRPNIWIGPAMDVLIHYGAVFAPCMRPDAGIRLEYSMRGLQAGLLLGCCEVASRNTAGTSTMEECEQLTAGVGIWREGLPCGQRRWTLGQVAHVLRPCCYGVQGMCQLTTQSHCLFLQGTFHQQGPEHCAQVNCLSSTCGMGGLQPDATQPYLPESSNQQWRLLIGPFLHQGVIYLVLVVLLEVAIGRQIEILAGPARLAAIFFYSGVISLVLGAVFSPYVPHCGAGGATFSLVGILIVELCQSWQLVAHPWREAAKLGAVVLLFLASGTLPYVDNFELLGGLIFGILMSILLLPYVTFGRWHAARRRLLVLVSAPIILVTSVFIFYMFYHVQTLDQVCDVCQLINCVPYTKTMCNMTNLQ